MRKDISSQNLTPKMMPAAAATDHLEAGKEIGI
jgi:hypothetical protein